MKKIKKSYIYFLLAVIGFCSIFACIPKPIHLKMGIFAGSNWEVPMGDTYKLIDDIIDEFTKKHPNITVSYDSGIIKDDYSSWLNNKAVFGELPDVFFVLDNDFGTLASIGALKNLDYFLYNDHEFNPDHYFSDILTRSTYNGKCYALPYQTNPQLMFVNTTLLEKEGIEKPNKDWTLNDLYRICSKVSKDTDNNGSIDQGGIINYTWQDVINAHGTDLFSEDGKQTRLTQPEIKEALTYMNKLEELNKGTLFTQQDFDDGKIAFAPLTYADYQAYSPYPWRIKKYSAFEWECLPMPKAIASNAYSNINVQSMAISAKSKYPIQSWELLKAFCYEKEAQMSIMNAAQGISPIKIYGEKIMNQEDENILDFSTLEYAMNHIKKQAYFKKYDTALNMISNGIEEISQGSEDLDLSLVRLQNEINQYLQD